jgi:quercetin dioxygenase-like cupin family protein
MHSLCCLIGMLVGVLLGMTAPANAQGIAKPDLALRNIVDTMPRSGRQEIRVMTASFRPGDRTVTHTHRFPVTVYVLEGTFTLELEGREPMSLKAGSALVEPPNVKMTGYNASASQPTRVVIFYVSDVDTPFLDITH